MMIRRTRQYSYHNFGGVITRKKNINKSSRRTNVNIISYFASSSSNQQQLDNNNDFHRHYYDSPVLRLIVVATNQRCWLSTSSSRSSSSSSSSGGNKDTTTKAEGMSNDRKSKKEESPPIPSSTATATATTTSSSSSTSTCSSSDPPILTWVDDYLPIKYQPYARLARMDKPIGTWLLLWPCFWSTAMAAASSSTTTTTSTLLGGIQQQQQLELGGGLLPDPYLMGLFTVGAFVMRGAGCTINDMWDQDYDKRVKRTSQRPLANGELTQQQAMKFLALQLSAGLSVLVSLPNTYYCFLWGTASLPLVVIYPLMKRYTDWPQLVLGLTFNWGAWMGWAATYGTMDYSIIAPLYLSGVSWTLVYDTIYANQDKEDDEQLGLKSTALTFGHDETKHKRILHGFAALTYLQWLLAGYNLSSSSLDTTTMMMVDDIISSSSSSFTFPLYAVGVTSAYSHLIWQIQTADLNNPHNLAERFRSNTTVGAIIFGSIVAGKVF